MADSTIAYRVTDVISRVSGFDMEEITEDKDLWDDIGLDSLDLVELTVSLEEEFAIEIPDEDTGADNEDNPLRKVSGLIKYIEDRISSLN